MLGVAPPPPPPVPVPPPEPETTEPEWTVALTDEQHEEMRTPEVIELYVRGSIDHETFIWADGMDDWKRPWEIPMIAAGLEARGMTRPTGEEEPKRASAPEPWEPSEEDATIVASARSFGMPPSSRGGGHGPPSSGMWREPGREVEDREVGFEDVTVSFDSKQAEQAIAKLRGQVEEEPEPPKSAPSPEDAFEDLPTRIDERGISRQVDELLSDLDPTLARNAQPAQPFQLDLLPGGGLLGGSGDEEQTTIEPAAAQKPNDSLLSSLDRPIQPGLPGEAADAATAEQDLFGGLDLGQHQPGHAEPIDSLLGASSPAYAQAPLAPPVIETAPRKKSRLGCVLVLLLLMVVVVGAGAASFYLKQPPSLYGPDGMPKLPEKLPKIPGLNG